MEVADESYWNNRRASGIGYAHTERILKAGDEIVCGRRESKLQESK
ncbi:hypothetical protein [Terribacillus aidingensis]|nr:hypothetical protein [Terribacillus aidingensis]